MGDMASEEEVGHLPSLSPSRPERMHQQCNAFLEEEDHWQDVRIFMFYNCFAVGRVEIV